MSDMELAAFARRRMRLAGRRILDEIGNPWFVALDGLRRDVVARGRPFVSFANYDYLGLADHPAVREAATAAIRDHGTGALGSRLVGGERLMHRAFEGEIADFLGHEAAITLVSGYLANQQTIAHLTGVGDLILYDELSHNSIVAGVRSSRAAAVAFRHGDLAHLRELLEARRASARHCLVVIESVYSMDGDVADLPGLLALKDEFGFWLLVDEAHSVGALGATGRGVAERFGVDPRRIDLVVGTLSKAFVSCGGFVCASGDVIDWLRFTLPGFVFSVGLAPPIAAGARAALGVLRAEPERVGRLLANAARFVGAAKAAGLDTGLSEGTGVAPVLLPDLLTTMRAAEALLEAGYYAPPVVHVGVPKDGSRIRFFLSAAHRTQDIDGAVATLAAFRDSVAESAWADAEA
ncbi:MAG: aminotransferase class I/II-fold pyridoxal phosphate-dependent enzyme [Hyphomicrobiales bacterium]|nr:aminotransferase class I/II-fold pyridoxal phosphate-dependent enzyme [Hyphomicrobiales bacterium]